ncbi:MAG: ABC transporter permease, partial [Candidatus Brocadiae bacterium]|nr:ABC transporter permease [Candidatus Brocadiia bacterium]
WFQDGDRHVCILPDDVAERVGIKPEHLAGKTDDEKPTIAMLGHSFRVIGLIDSEAFNAYRDIDDEKLTPVDTLQEAAKMDTQENPDEAAKAPIQAFTHIESSNTMLVPYEFAMGVGGTLRSIAISHFDGFRVHIRRFMERVALNIFIAEGAGDDASVEVLSSIQTTSFSGVGNLFVPILIAALIVLNTMTGSVYERFREIHIYSSVGLAPTHIGALFLAEACVFATVGAVAGYLIGQTVAGVVLHFGWLGAITLNYSSVSTIYSSLVVMVTVFLSALYPAKKASDMAVPDVTRRWEFPPPVGDDWQFEFPFTVGGTEILGMYAYLTRFLQSYGETSIGAFYTEDVVLDKAEASHTADYVISARCWLAPYDLGISQDVRFEAVPTGEHGLYAMDVIIHRLSGDTLSWQRMNRGFLNVLRKQFLVWRTVPSGVKLQFADEGRQAVGEPAPDGSEPESEPA